MMTERLKLSRVTKVGKVGTDACQWWYYLCTIGPFYWFLYQLIKISADDEDDAAGAGPNGAAGGQGQGQMLYIPGLGYIPLSSLGNIPGLTMGRQGAAGPQAAAAAPIETEKEWTTLEDFPVSVLRWPTWLRPCSITQTNDNIPT